MTFYVTMWLINVNEMKRNINTLKECYSITSIRHLYRERIYPVIVKENSIISVLIG